MAKVSLIKYDVKNCSPRSPGTDTAEGRSRIFKVRNLLTQYAVPARPFLFVFPVLAVPAVHGHFRQVRSRRPALFFSYVTHFAGSDDFLSATQAGARRVFFIE
jgi:hypothetical protein